ncbi:hypothetical protein WMY93_018669 [Mugilogobius chulae]|uniref:SAM domain-containing protein n=1 Tax=Mugilogobius chulae TaxID=88201 RepID=A0AAW0NPH7_9GOBI
MAAQCDTLYLQQSDQGSNSERSTDSPLPGSEEDMCGPHPDPEWMEERFRVDRKKLELMLLAASEGRVNGGEDFFQKIMDETQTQIAWPSKLKIGAKSKKDPHIKVCGKRDNVREAKERIMSVLDTKSNRVTLKMDVSHTEHSHVIGKGGNNIKRVMEETGCHIHFPDSNRNNQAEKSNQVSIAGQPAGVEAARVKIRELLPLVLSFELPAIMQADPSSPTVQHISQTYNLTVSFKPPTRLYRATGVVRGSQNNANAVKRGTALLLEHLAGSLASTISVTTHLDIAPQHHLFMKDATQQHQAHNPENRSSDTLPRPQQPAEEVHRLHPGTIESVCLARQYLMGCLPLVLMFDIKEDIDVEPQCITALMEQLDVFISIKPKPKQPSKSVIVKSVERNAVNMYEARKFVLRLESNGVSCFLSAAAPHSLSSSPNAVLNSLNSSMSPLQTPVPPPQCIPPPCGQALSPARKHPSSVYTRITTASLAETVLSPPPCDPVQEASGHNPSEPLSSKSNPDEGSDTFVEVGMPRSPSHSANGSELKQMLASCKTSSGKRQAVELLQGTKNSHLHSDCLLSDAESSSSDSPVADKKAPGSERAAERAAQQNERDRIRLAPQSSLQTCRYRNTQQLQKECVNINLTAVHLSLQAFDYEQKKLLATKAMLKKPVVTEVRTPTNTWSGLGFSKSMPAETIKELRRANHVSYKPSMSTTYEGSPLSLSRSNSREGLGSGSDSDNWRERNGTANGIGHNEFSSAVSSPKRKQNKSAAEHYLSSSNYMDCISSVTGSNGCNLNCSTKGSDLPELFSKLGLGKYTDVFQQQEIDLQTFLTLTDQDLKELGITTFGARRKMLLAISELNKNRRKLFEPPIRSSFLEGGASGRLSRQFHDMASVSGRW